MGVRKGVTNEQVLRFIRHCCWRWVVSGLDTGHAAGERSNSRQFHRSSRGRMRPWLPSRPLRRMPCQWVVRRSLLGYPAGSCARCTCSRAVRRQRSASGLRPLWALPDGLQLIRAPLSGGPPRLSYWFVSGANQCRNDGPNLVGVSGDGGLRLGPGSRGRTGPNFIVGADFKSLYQRIV
jgi:hypothetical protein